jgi:2-haloacid dehalogenase
VTGPGDAPRALLFDVFGTCVDWRTSIARAGARAGERLGIEGVDWTRVADTWRARYGPALETVRDGTRPWTVLDVLHRESLDEVLAGAGPADALPAAERDALTLAWHRLDPWPDTAEGLARLRRRFVVAAGSNGHIALIVGLSRHAGLVWDAVLGAELAGTYKPRPEVYLRCARALGLPPGEVMMVAAHNADLRAAAGCGMRTAFVLRATEHGPGQTTDLAPREGVDVTAADLRDLAARLGA